MPLLTVLKCTHVRWIDEGKIRAVVTGAMHFLGKWLRLPMAIEILMHFWMCSITLPSSTDVNSFRKRLWRSNESTHFTEYLEGVSGIAIQHIRWRLQSSKHVSERAGGWFFSIGPSVLIGLCFFIEWKLPPPACPGTTGILGPRPQLVSSDNFESSRVRSLHNLANFLDFWRDLYREF